MAVPYSDLVYPHHIHPAFPHPLQMNFHDQDSNQALANSFNEHSPPFPRYVSQYPNTEFYTVTEPIESSTGPIRNTRRTRAVHSAEAGSSSSPYDNHAQQSAMYSSQRSSRPQTPQDMAPLEAHSPAILPPQNQYDTSTGAPSYEHYYITSNSRSTSGSMSIPRSASPALSVASGLTSASSAQSTSQQPGEARARPKNSKRRLDTIIKRRICMTHVQKPQLKQEEIARIYEVERSTISKILKEKDRWLSASPQETYSVAHYRPLAKFFNIEEDMKPWLEKCTLEGTTLTDALIQAKAREVAQRRANATFKASSGWLENYKKRFGISRGQWSGIGRASTQARAAVAAKKAQTQPSEPAPEVPTTPDVEQPAPQTNPEADVESEDEVMSVDHSMQPPTVPAQSAWPANDYAAQEARPGYIPIVSSVTIPNCNNPEHLLSEKPPRRLYTHDPYATAPHILHNDAENACRNLMIYVSRVGLTSSTENEWLSLLYGRLCNFGNDVPQDLTGR